MLLIKNGKVIENNKLINKDILINNRGLIVKVEENIVEPKAEIYDAKGNLVMPGAIDVHVHYREPGLTYKETIKTGTLSAAKGGVTTVMPMPNLNPCPDNLEHLMLEEAIIANDACVHCYPYGTVTVAEMDKEMADIKAMAPYIKAITDDGKGVNSLDILEEACKLAKEYNLVVASHAEDNPTKDKYGLTEPSVEYIAVRREIEIAKKTGCKYHFCHMSTAESFKAIKAARSEGYTNITCEIAPHHLIWNDSDVKGNPNMKMNPPLRPEVDRLATIEALLDGTADMIASDHAPHSEKEKSQEYNKCPNGIVGVENMIPTIITYFVKKNLISWDRFLDLLVYNPIKVFNLPARKLEAGYPADIAILDIDNKYTYTKEEILSLGKNCPYVGMEFYGNTLLTLVNGKIVYKK